MKNQVQRPTAEKAGNNKYNLRQVIILSYSVKVITQEGYGKASIRRIAREMGMSISAPEAGGVSSGEEMENLLRQALAPFSWLWVFHKAERYPFPGSTSRVYTGGSNSCGRAS